jgi:outer membrane protein assembly factor BamB
MRCKQVRRSLLVAASVLAAAHLAAENWPQWRGPAGDGTSPDRGLPAHWSKTENVAWRLAMPGPAASTPAVFGERIFVTSVEGDDLVLLCVSTAGEVVWTRKLGTGNKDSRGDEGNSACPSATTDGQHVWSFVSSGDLHCHDMAGNLVWTLNLQKEHGHFDHWFSMSSTPLVEGGALYQMVLRSEKPYLIALDKLSGKLLWKRDRESDADHESRHSYASPVLYRDAERKLLLIHGADYLTAHRLEDGAEVWRCAHLNPKEDYNRTLRFIASPVAQPGLIVAPSAKGNPVVAVKPSSQGAVGASDLLWKRDRDTTDVPTPAIHDGLVYMPRENGVLFCLDARTGEEVYVERLHRTRQRSSPVVADGKVYIASRDGEVFVVQAGRKFEILAKNAMGEAIAATPAIANGVVYLRTFAALYAVKEGAVKKGGAEAAAGKPEGCRVQE